MIQFQLLSSTHRHVRDDVHVVLIVAAHIGRALWRVLQAGGARHPSRLALLQALAGKMGPLQIWYQCAAIFDSIRLSIFVSIVEHST